jgi:hypothetical protein
MNELYDELVRNVKRYYEQSDKMKNGYFWGGFGNSRQREWFMNQYNFQYSAQYDGNEYEMIFKVDPSRNHLYKRQSILLNGKKVQRKTIAKLLEIEL